jgi:hypothetical protein
MSTLTIAGIDRWSLLAYQSLRIEDQLNARNICEFTLFDSTGAARPLVGQAVVLTLDGTRRFAGTVHSYRERNVTSRTSNTVRQFNIRCVDPNSFCDRHIHAEVYDNMEFVDIVRDIAVTHLYPDGIILDPTTADGPTIEFYAANYISVAQIFDELSEMTGYYWYIDYDYVLHFIDRTSMTAPYSLNASTPVDLVETLDIEHTQAQYRNFQYIRGGKAVTDLQLTETMKGDGETKTFTTSLPVASTPTVSIDTGSGFVAKTVGIRQVDTGRDWYWQEDSNEISQDTSGTVLGATHVLRVVYYGYYPLIDAARIQSEVEARQAIEGGSGLYESIEHRDDITSADMSRLRAEGLLSLFGEIQTTVSFSTDTLGWQAGQLMAIDRPEHGIDEDFLIAEVTLEHSHQLTYRYHVRAVSGALVENWVAFFKRLALQPTRNARKPNEVINLLRLFYEDVTVSEGVFPAPTTPASVMGEVLANEIAVASSSEKHWVSYSLVGDLLQTINYVLRDEDLHVGITEGTTAFIRGVTSDTTRSGITETSTLVTA